MFRSIAAIVVTAASISFSAPQAAEAQLGKIIKKKVKEAITPPEKSNPAPKPAESGPGQPSSSEPASNSRDSFAHQRVPNERALLITDGMMARVRRGLDAETAMLKDLEKEIAAYPTPETIQACKVKASQTPEGQRLMNPGNFVKAGMTPEQTQAGMMKMTTESDAYYKKACPWDENKWSDYNRSEARSAIRTEAAAQALPPSAGQSAESSDPGLDENEFGEVIERILKYCELKKTMDMSPKTGGIKVPGIGQDIYWIFTVSELEVLAKLDCDAFRKKYAGQIGA